MAFTDFPTLDDTATEFQISVERAGFVEPFAQYSPMRQSVRDDLEFTLHQIPFDRSEAFICEALIYPILREVWYHYRDSLTLLSHETIRADDKLSGIVDYVVCKRSPLGPLIPDRPLLLIGEAKRDNFARGWGQALGGMLAAQQLSGPELTYFGLSTNGRIWELGRLQQTRFQIDHRIYTVTNLDELVMGLHFVFSQCKDQLLLLSNRNGHATH
jgi:hypothetical protein